MRYLRKLCIVIIMLVWTAQVSAASIQPQVRLPGTTVYLPMVFGASAASSAELEVLALVNQERAKIAGCPALQWNTALSKAAHAHSQDMADNNFFSHTGSDGSSAADRAIAAGYSSRYIGENIAGGHTSAAEAFQDWMGSSGHRANIRNCSYTDTGIGYVNKPGSQWTHYWTQVFGAQR